MPLTKPDALKVGDVQIVSSTTQDEEATPQSAQVSAEASASMTPRKKKWVSSLARQASTATFERFKKETKRRNKLFVLFGVIILIFLTFSVALNTAFMFLVVDRAVTTTTDDSSGAPALVSKESKQKVRVAQTEEPLELDSRLPDCLLYTSPSPRDS